MSPACLAKAFSKGPWQHWISRMLKTMRMARTFGRTFQEHYKNIHFIFYFFFRLHISGTYIFQMSKMEKKTSNPSFHPFGSACFRPNWTLTWHKKLQEAFLAGTVWPKMLAGMVNSLRSLLKNYALKITESVFGQISTISSWLDQSSKGWVLSTYSASDLVWLCSTDIPGARMQIEQLEARKLPGNRTPPYKLDYINWAKYQFEFSVAIDW